MEHKQRTANSRLRPPKTKKIANSRLLAKRISPLGRKLMALRREIESSHIPLLSDEEIAKEQRERRGGAYAH